MMPTLIWLWLYLAATDAAAQDAFVRFCAMYKTSYVDNLPGYQDYFQGNGDKIARGA